MRNIRKENSKMKRPIHIQKKKKKKNKKNKKKINHLQILIPFICF